MTILPPSPRLDTQAGIDWHLDRLVALDPRLASVRALTGTPEPRINAAGFPGIAKIVVGQQVSVASARAIWSRFELLDGALDPVRYLGLEETQVRAVGFSAGKFRTLRVIAEAVVAGQLDFAHLETLPAEQAVAYLVAHKGIGPWTAEVYLMFCAGHPDVFPAGDLALLKAVQDGLGLEERPTIKQMVELAKPWSPHRSAAALLFWRLFAVQKQRAGIVI
ncbi:DNA-3-methyladenine glycosylase II [Devosia sp. UYZn731]|uniref:DNA-3-methyladenine glycosylase family protein n=1 Tax=Devosia sp. UYZn731 TaxID=3156345 RepID=UPI0033909CB6